VAKVVPLTFNFNGTAPSQPGKPARVAFHGSAATKRDDFGMNRYDLQELGLSPRVVAPHLLDYSSIQWLSSEYRESHRSYIDGLKMLLESASRRFRCGRVAGLEMCSMRRKAA